MLRLNSPIEMRASRVSTITVVTSEKPALAAVVFKDRRTVVLDCLRRVSRDYAQIRSLISITHGKHIVNAEASAAMTTRE